MPHASVVNSLANCRLQGYQDKATEYFLSNHDAEDDGINRYNRSERMSSVLNDISNDADITDMNIGNGQNDYVDYMRQNLDNKNFNAIHSPQRPDQSSSASSRNESFDPSSLPVAVQAPRMSGFDANAPCMSGSAVNAPSLPQAASAANPSQSPLQQSLQQPLQQTSGCGITANQSFPRMDVDGRDGIFIKRSTLITIGVSVVGVILIVLLFMMIFSMNTKINTFAGGYSRMMRMVPSTFIPSSSPVASACMNDSVANAPVSHESMGGYSPSYDE